MIIQSQRRLLRAAALAAFLSGVLGAFQGCASYTSATKKGLDDFDRRDFTDADKEYAKADQDGVDQLVYLFDRRTASKTSSSPTTSRKSKITPRSPTVSRAW
jgi:hypothetical protein